MGGGLKRIVWLTAVILFLFLARKPLFMAVGSFLIVQDELKQVDVIIVLGGDDERVKEAVYLYKEGISKNMIMTGGSSDAKVSKAEVMKRQAMRLGIPEERIILEPKSRHTYEHPIFVKPILRAQGFKSAIVLSSPYHMRRSAMLFDRAFKDSGIKLIYYPVQESWFKVDQWWTSAISRKTVCQEYMKLVVNAFGNRFSKFIVNLVRKDK